MEFALVLPILVVLVVSVGELGLIFGKMQQPRLRLARGGPHRVLRWHRARVHRAATLATQDPSLVDATSSVPCSASSQSPDSGIDLAKIQEIRIFKATSTGGETASKVNIWTYSGPDSGPTSIPVRRATSIDFGPRALAWPACDRAQRRPQRRSIRSASPSGTPTTS